MLESLRAEVNNGKIFEIFDSSDIFFIFDAQVCLLIENEICFAYHQNRRVTCSILNRIVDHIDRIRSKMEFNGISDNPNSNPSAVVEQIPLTFVLNEAESLVEFRSQLTQMSNTYFKIAEACESLFYAVLDRVRYKTNSFSVERPVAELTSSESADMKPEDQTLPVSRLNPIFRRNPSKAVRFLKRSQSFSEFSRFYLDEREKLLKGKWSSVSDVMTFDGRLLKRLELRSGNTASADRYWSGASTITSNNGNWSKNNFVTSKDQITTETGMNFFRFREIF